MRTCAIIHPLHLELETALKLRPPASVSSKQCKTCPHAYLPRQAIQAIYGDG